MLNLQFICTAQLRKQSNSQTSPGICRQPLLFPYPSRAEVVFNNLKVGGVEKRERKREEKKRKEGKGKEKIRKEYPKTPSLLVTFRVESTEEMNYD